MVFAALSVHFWQTTSEVGFVMVLVGVIGEGIEFLTKFAAKRRGKPLSETFTRRAHLIEFGSWVLLIVGLATEFLGSHVATQLSESENAQLKLKASQLAQTIEQLRKDNLQLEAQIAPRRISPLQRTAIIDRLRNLP